MRLKNDTAQIADSICNLFRLLKKGQTIIFNINIFIHDHNTVKEFIYRLNYLLGKF